MKKNEIRLIPEEWVVKTLNELYNNKIIFFQNGFPCGKWNENNVGIPQLRPFNITEYGEINLNIIKYIETDKNIKNYKLIDNDIIFNNTNSESLVGKTSIWKMTELFVLSNHMTIIRIIDKKFIDSFYLSKFLHYLWFMGEYKKLCQRHVNQASVSVEKLKNIQIPLPPIPEQKKIAYILSTIQNAIEKQDEIIQTATELKKSMMHKLFTEGLHGEKQKDTEIGLVPESWEKIKIKNIGDCITGTTPTTKKTEYWITNDIDFITPADIGKTRYIYNSERKISLNGYNASRKLPKDSIICVCIGSTIGKVGMTYKIDSCTNQQINSIVCNENYNAIFVYYLLFYYNKYWKTYSTPSPVPILNKGRFEEINLYITENKIEQQQIAQILTSIDDKIEYHTNKKTTLTELFKSMLHNLMTGQIRVNNINFDKMIEDQ